MKGHTISVFGGSGFLGTYIVRALLKSGANVRIYSDNPNSALCLKIDAALGQLQLHKINICDHNSIKEAIIGSDSVINLIGIKQGSAKQLFITHVLFPKLLAKYAKQLHVSKFIHFSAIGVDKMYESTYAHSKYEGDQCVHRELNKSVILRPSLAFGQKDHLISKLYFLLPRLSIFPISNKMNSIKPIYAGDLAKALMFILQNYRKYQGKTLELTGSKSYSLGSIINIIGHTLGKNIHSVSLPKSIYRAYIILSRFFPEPIMNKEHSHLLRYAGRNKKNHLKQMNIEATDLETFITSYKEQKIHEK